MSNQAQEIIDYIREHPGSCTEDIVEGTGWNRVVIEHATSIMKSQGMIREVGRTDWDDPKFEIAG